VVCLRGRVAEELAGEYRRADLFVLPTRTDAFPIAVVEAMAAGLPVIDTDVGAIPWMLDGGACGVVVPAGEVEPLARALVRLAADPGERRALGERGRARQAERFDARAAALGSMPCSRAAPWPARPARL
jgi:glycosyltransferase involved in cell wall biosynthesis